jgi:diguanylate cyclase (GGDEF)-like protein
VVLPGADGPAAQALGERLQRAVAALGETHPTSPSGVVTVSVGVATEVPQPGRTVDDLIADADACLYQAKQRGRNRVVSHLPV